ncbi:MAG: ferritin-like domain-containing protein [bacterium]
MDVLKASEVLEIAIKIEENGEAFYRKTADRGDQKFRQMFEWLADEEVKHKAIFKKMLSRVEGYKPAEAYPGEYFAYIRSYANRLVFTPEKLEKEITKVRTKDDAIEFAIQREIESILYYLEVKSLVPEGQRCEIDKILDEERRHYLKLVDLKKA